MYVFSVGKHRSTVQPLHVSIVLSRNAGRSDRLNRWTNIVLRGSSRPSSTTSRPTFAAAWNTAHCSARECSPRSPRKRSRPGPLLWTLTHRLRHVGRGATVMSSDSGWGPREVVLDVVSLLLAESVAFTIPEAARCRDPALIFLSNHFCSNDVCPR